MAMIDGKTAIERLWETKGIFHNMDKMTEVEAEWILAQIERIRKKNREPDTDDNTE